MHGRDAPPTIDASPPPLQASAMQRRDVFFELFELLGTGWDNTVWLVDGRWVFRFPRRRIAVPGIARQLAVLPAIAPALPLAIPVPVVSGRPAEGFPWPFTAHELLPGREIETEARRLLWRHRAPAGHGDGDGAGDDRRGK